MPSTPDICAGHFYPRSPCGERRQMRCEFGDVKWNFYPRSPCGERPWAEIQHPGKILISIHALLAESDHRRRLMPKRSHWISIHALLAESDGGTLSDVGNGILFLSTLSLRRATACQQLVPCIIGVFLSTLSLRRATYLKMALAQSEQNFYPRSPCGERLHETLHRRRLMPFLSTLSLRRATICHSGCPPVGSYFYPRSPCGERLLLIDLVDSPVAFLSTLSLRRATRAAAGRSV